MNNAGWLAGWQCKTQTQMNNKTHVHCPTSGSLNNALALELLPLSTTTTKRGPDGLTKDRGGETRPREYSIKKILKNLKMAFGTMVGAVNS